MRESGFYWVRMREDGLSKAMKAKMVPTVMWCDGHEWHAIGVELPIYDNRIEVLLGPLPMPPTAIDN